MKNDRIENANYCKENNKKGYLKSSVMTEIEKLNIKYKRKRIEA